MSTTEQRHQASELFQWADTVQDAITDSLDLVCALQLMSEATVAGNGRQGDELRGAVEMLSGIMKNRLVPALEAVRDIHSYADQAKDGL
jgi:hypothetical protein